MARSLSSENHPDMVTGLFRSRDSAEQAFRSAVELGYDRSDINLLMSNETRERCFPDGSAPHAGSALAREAAETSEEPAKGAELGGPLGGTAGILAPVLAAVGTLLLVPGIIMAGPIAVALTAAGAVGIAGGIAGALTDWGIPKERVRRYEDEIREGGILIGVKPRSDGDARCLEQQWKAAGGEWVQ